MRIKFLLVSAILLAAVALSACGGTTVVSNPAPPQRMIERDRNGFSLSHTGRGIYQYRRAHGTTHCFRGCFSQ